MASGGLELFWASCLVTGVCQVICQVALCKFARQPVFSHVYAEGACEKSATSKKYTSHLYESKICKIASRALFLRSSVAGALADHVYWAIQTQKTSFA